MPGRLRGSSGLGDDRVGQRRPRRLGPVAEVEVGQARAGEPGVRVDPEKRAAAAEVAKGSPRGTHAGPVRVLRALELDPESPVVRVEAAVLRQDAGEALELD